MAVRSFSVAIPGNRNISCAEKDRRIRLYYAPFREALLAEVRRSIEKYSHCIHLSVHSFTPVVDGVVRKADIGILYDPTRRREKRLAGDLIGRIAAEGFRVRRNYPYRGVSDGHTTHLRTRFPETRYLGLELEVNQALLRTPGDIRRVARKLAKVVGSLAGAC
jgi:predicted N-formylglutamate amidohydrolase